MSIASRTGQGPSITDTNEALAFFTDRSPLIRHFAGYLNGDPAHDRILFLHGEGGNGKLTIFLAIAKALWSPSNLVDLAQVLLDSVDRHFQGQFSLYAQRRNLSRSAVERILRMDHNRDLINQLPILFAEDLNAAMAMPEMPARVALLFDTHDALWRGQGTEKQTALFAHDTWLRTLLVNLNLSDGIVVVVCGREVPFWHEAPTSHIPKEYLDSQYLGCLRTGDAEKYLELARIDDDATRRHLITMAQVAPDQVHPFLLGLVVDLHRAAAERKIVFAPDADFVRQGVSEKIRAILDRLLTYVKPDIHNAVLAVSACRSFDTALHQHLGAALNFGTTKAAFDTLTEFSFVSPVSGQGDRPRYRIHDLIRRLLREQGDAETQRADAVLEAYYRDRAQGGDEAAAAEAIYHANRLDWERGVSEWVDAMESAIHQSRYGLCEALLAIRPLLDVRGDWTGLVSALAGDFNLLLSRHGDAEQEFIAAIAACDQALDRAPDYIYALNNKGNALQRLGDLHAGLSRNKDALASYRSAVSSYDRTVALAPEFSQSRRGRAEVLDKIARLTAD